MNDSQDGAGSQSDEQLLARFLDGDDTAFAVIVGRHGPDLHQFVVRFVRNQASAEDVVQETFVQIHHSAPNFDVGRRFRPWLYTIAANKARDHLRSRSRKREVSLSGSQGLSTDADMASYLDFFSDNDSSPSEKLEEAERRQLIRGIITRMPDHLREVLVLGYYQRFPYKEIAEILAIPLGTVKSRLHAAVLHFGTAYKNELEKHSDGAIQGSSEA